MGVLYDAINYTLWKVKSKLWQKSEGPPGLSLFMQKTKPGVGLCLVVWYVKATVKGWGSS